jgi:hypothetical protein
MLLLGKSIDIKRFDVPLLDCRACGNEFRETRRQLTIEVTLK